MKKIILVLIVSLIVISCSKKQVPFEAFSSEAFVFDIGDGIAEVNSTVRVKGFVQTEKDDNYKAAVNDVALEAQFNLDSTNYKSGVYTLIYKIADTNSENTLETEVNFDLEW